MANTFLDVLKEQLDQIRDAPRLSPPQPVEYYALTENFNLTKYKNSELAWTMNHNNSLPNWRIYLGG